MSGRWGCFVRGLFVSGRNHDPHPQTEKFSPMKRSRVSSILAAFGGMVLVLPAIASADAREREVAAYSTRASNIDPSGSRSVVTPALPTPPVPSADPPRSFLLAARSAVERGQTGEAQEALERAETRLLDRPVDPARADVPDSRRAVLDMAVARRFLAARDRVGALRAIDDALMADTVSPVTALAAPLPPRPGPAQPAALPPPPSLVPRATYALLPGHWQLQGATYHWVPPETTPRRVEPHTLVPGLYVWRNGAWVWVGVHYDD